MNIVISKLESYCVQNGYPSHVEVPLEATESVFRCVAGKPEMKSSLAVYLTGKEMMDILSLNGIIGDSGKVRSLLDNPGRDIDKEIDDLIYGTLSKYIIQMLHASMAVIVFPELIPLAHHKDTYFRDH